MKRLLLFDIDGTLLDCGRKTRGIVARALEDTFGKLPRMEGYSFAGRTDRGILFDLMEAAGVTGDAIAERLPEMKKRYLDALEQGLRADDMRLLPGVTELLEAVETDPHEGVGLLTGNWEQGARIKLSRFNLNRFFPFGAFGDVSRHRADLVPAALANAWQATGVRFEPAQTVLIGDAVPDVECALHHGAQIMAVSTGGTSADDLRAAGAPRVASSLEEVGEWLRED